MSKKLLELLLCAKLEVKQRQTTLYVKTESLLIGYYANRTNFKRLDI